MRFVVDERLNFDYTDPVKIELDSPPLMPDSALADSTLADSAPGDSTPDDSTLADSAPADSAPADSDPAEAWIPCICSRLQQLLFLLL